MERLLRTASAASLASLGSDEDELAGADAAAVAPLRAGEGGTLASPWPLDAGGRLRVTGDTRELQGGPPATAALQSAAERARLANEARMARRFGSETKTLLARQVRPPRPSHLPPRLLSASLPASALLLPRGQQGR